MLAGLRNFITPNHPPGLVASFCLVFLSVVNPVLAVFVLLVLAVLTQARENYGVLEQCGIPVVEPTLFLGSEPEIHKTVLHLADIERFKQFGGIWGSYVGRMPQVYIADPELIRLIFVKDFIHFADRSDVDFGSPILNEILDFQPGEKWKLLRTSMSPLFTTSKLKQMSDVIADSAGEFMSDLKSECDSDGRLKIDTRKRLTAWLIDMFARTTLGVRLEDAKNPENKFATAFREMMADDEQYNQLYSLGLAFPFLSRFAPALNDGPSKLIESTFRQIIEARKQSGESNQKDFLDVLCSLWDRVPTKEFRDMGITQTTILAQAVNFFLGGYDTAATTLTHLLHFMAENPEIQDKMHSELEEALGRAKKQEIQYELMKDSEIPYIIACINESLRLAPPVIRPERLCTKDWSFNDIKIKKGTLVILASWAANVNPKAYPDEPEKFKPERFLPENKSSLEPYAFTTFGFGPRNCIGMRFGYETLKLFTCNLVKNFRVEKREDTSINYKTGARFLVGYTSPIYLDLVQRQ